MRMISFHTTIATVSRTMLNIKRNLYQNQVQRLQHLRNKTSLLPRSPGLLFGAEWLIDDAKDGSSSAQLVHPDQHRDALQALRANIAATANTALLSISAVDVLCSGI